MYRSLVTFLFFSLTLAPQGGSRFPGCLSLMLKQMSFAEKGHPTKKSVD